MALTLIAVGALSADAEHKTIAGGRELISFSIPHTERYTSNGEKKEKTTWLKVTRWGKNLSGLAGILKKGTMVFVEGMPSANAYKANNGDAKATLELNAIELQIISGGAKKNGSSNYSTSNTSDNSIPEGGGESSDLPF